MGSNRSFQCDLQGADRPSGKLRFDPISSFPDIIYAADRPSHGRFTLGRHSSMNDVREPRRLAF
jgi:hypothetical protein